MADRRDEDHIWYDTFDESRMVLVLEDGAGVAHEMPAVYAVCDTCDGQGSHVNPAIDAHGLSREDFDEDPDFAESYFRGDYDQPCNECQGRRVVPVLDTSRATPADVARCKARINDRTRSRLEVAAERRMGA